jgi:hypothetical protein
MLEQLLLRQVSAAKQRAMRRALHGRVLQVAALYGSRQCSPHREMYVSAHQRYARRASIYGFNAHWRRLFRIDRLIAEVRRQSIFSEFNFGAYQPVRDR